MPEQDKTKKLIFHVKNDDYFGTLATILDLFRQDLMEKKFIFDKEKLLKKIIKDLRFFQANYKIIEKNERNTKPN